METETEIICSECDGSGINEEYLECTACNGTGLIILEEQEDA